MCLNSRKIINRTLHFTAENNPYFLEVPCGKCEECAKHNRNSWFVRSYFEWRDNSWDSSFFYTLTYNNENLPHYANKVPCFSKRHIQLFLKRLRKDLSQYGVRLRYIITCEHGELRKRPHYHVIFFLSNNFNPYRFYKLVEKCWTYGFVKYGDNMGLIKDYRGIQYVTKYISKDISFMDDNMPPIARSIYIRYNDLLNYINRRYDKKFDFSLHLNKDTFVFSIRDFNGRSLKEEHLYYDFAKLYLRKIRGIINNIIPFHLQSTKLGSTLIKDPISLDLINERVSIPLNDNFKSYPLPRYFKRMLWYDCVENERDGKRNKFVLNDAGKYHRLEVLHKRVNDLTNKYRTILLDSCHISKSDLFEVNNAGHKFLTETDITYFLDHFDLDLEVMAIYSLVFRGRLNYMYNFPFSEQVIKDNYIDIAEFHLFSVQDYDIGKVYELRAFDDVQRLESLLFDRSYFFEPYEKALTIFEALDLSLRKKTTFADIYNNRLARKTREVMQETLPF